VRKGVKLFNACDARVVSPPQVMPECREVHAVFR